MPKKPRTEPVPVEQITHSIIVLRGQKSLAGYQSRRALRVTTGALVQAVKQNRERFPADFMLQLSANEWEILRSQIVISSEQHGGRRYLPYAFTEQGVAMLSSRFAVSGPSPSTFQIMRAFVRIRELIHSNRELARQLKELDARLKKKLTVHDEAIVAILAAIRQLLKPAVPKRRPIGFTADIETKV